MPILGRLFAAYEAKIRRLPRRRPTTESDVITPGFRLDHDDRLAIYYAPVDWLSPTARLAIVGITPGKNTMVVAYQTAADCLAAGYTPAPALRQVKSAAPFSGFRVQLVQWLDYLRVHRHLGLSGSGALWAPEGRKYLHSTSAVRYPVLKHGTNYSGRDPELSRHPILRRYVLDLLATELAKIPEALIVPLGGAAQCATTLLVDERALDPRRCLSGFPHPSGANGNRMRQWAANKDHLRRAVATWFREHPVAR
jgi:hypothetical protein